ncbi:UNVERIFIED_CONTAM: hypothetical protein Sangu_3133200 [Sesamum angustifolium]|uniref:Uncharacterized protein n=1 Tax=Sesamum angustifolium TaxID=2727405 RepID=A0AAW2K0S2_9LAMI
MVAIERMLYPRTLLVTDDYQSECPPSVPHLCRGCYGLTDALGGRNAQGHQRSVS